MKNRFDFVRVYDEPSGYFNPYDNIEFVVSSNILKKVIEVLKMSSKEICGQSKHQDGRMVINPQNYEQFKLFLSQTKIDEELGDIRVVYQQRAPLIAQNLDRNSVTLYYDNDLFTEGYPALVDFAKDMLYDGTKIEPRAVDHQKRVFLQQANKIHKQLVEEYQQKHSQKQ